MKSNRMSLILFSGLATVVVSGQGFAQGKRSYTSHHFQLELDSAPRTGGALAGAKRGAPRQAIKKKPPSGGGRNQMTLDDASGSAEGRGSTPAVRRR
jgi:hypothetical protein